MKTLLLSTYELGHQPFGLASPAAWLRKAGIEVNCLDLTQQPFSEELAFADLIAIHLPMHTATRLAVPVIRHVQKLNPNASLCCYGLYAPLNEAFLHTLGVHYILGGEFESDLVDIAVQKFESVPASSSDVPIPRLNFIVPDRSDLPPLDCYASLQYGSEKRIVGYTETSRGCKHFCRHCPIVPIYKGHFRVIPVDVVLADIRAQVDVGAKHITFGDPDFFNGVGHALKIIDKLAREFEGLTYDVTIKIEHLLRYSDHLEHLVDTGCLFVTSAVESFDDAILARLRKGHNRTDIFEVLERCQSVGLNLTPTFVAFTPWTTLEGYCQFLQEIKRAEWIDHVAPIQLAIRLLVPEGSRLLELADVRAQLESFDSVRLAYPWHNGDPSVDMLCDSIGNLVAKSLDASRRSLFGEVWELAHQQAGLEIGSHVIIPPGRVEVPHLNEPWYC